MSDPKPPKKPLGQRIKDGLKAIGARIGVAIGEAKFDR